MVVSVIRANISQDERKKILREVQIIAGEMVKDIYNKSNDKREDNTYEPKNE